MSPEGKSFSYDAKASGFGRGEGGACLLIKRLDDAVRCGDPVHAIIRNTACNHSGRSEGITMPSRALQERLLQRVHKEAGLDPAETPVVEVYASHSRHATKSAYILIRDTGLVPKSGKPEHIATYSRLT